MDIKLTKQQLYAMLGIMPDEDMENIQVIIKNIKTDQILNQFSLDQIFEGQIQCPCNLEAVIL